MNPEEIYPPKAGGMVDSIRQQRQAAEPEVTVTEELGATTAHPVPVKDVLPEVLGARTPVVTSTNPAVRILGADRNRKRAVIIAVDAAIVLAVSQSQADDPRNATTTAGNTAGGFVLPQNVPHVVEASGEVWAAYAGTASRVSIWTETYGG